MSKKYLIKEEKLLELLESHLRLSALDQGGVDNWDWYGDSLSDWLEREGKDDFEEAALDAVKEEVENGQLGLGEDRTG